MKNHIWQDLKRDTGCQMAFWMLIYLAFQVKTVWTMYEQFSTQILGKKNQQFVFIIWLFSIWTEIKYTSLQRRSGKNWMLHFMESVRQVYSGSQ